jgi:hypothetical protein
VPGRPAGQPGDDPSGQEQRESADDQRGQHAGGTEDEGQQWDQSADGEGRERRAGRGPRRRQVVGVDAELLAYVNAPGDVGLRGDLLRDLGGQLRAQALGLVHQGQLAQFLFGVALELTALDFDLLLGELALRGDRGVLAGGHRAGAGHQAGQAGEYDGVRGCAAADHTGDEREVRYEPVHDAERRRPEPAAGDVPM